MTSCRLFAITLSMAAVTATAIAVHAEVPQRPSRPATTPRDAPPATPAPANPRDHRAAEEGPAIEAVAIFREWVVGANRTGPIHVALNPFAPADAHYSIKGLERRKFLQRSGERVKWTRSASVEDEREAGHWVFYAQSQGVEDLGSGRSVRSRPLRYGERIAIVWQPFQGAGGKPEALLEMTSARTALLLYKRQSTGRLQYDWAIVGGKKGTAVRMGSDRVVLYNISRGQPLIHYPRKGGFPDDLGWPDMTAKASPALDERKHTELDRQIWDALLL